MSKKKLLQKVLAGPKNVHFNDMTTLVEAFGFRLSRVKGSHFIFVHPKIPEIVNLQLSTYKRKMEKLNLTRFVSSYT